MAEPAKGQQGGLCARTACDNTDAQYFNESTRQFYCRGCIAKINRHAGTRLCHLPDEETADGPGRTD